MRNWRQQWSFQAQKLINRTGDAQEVRKIINFELTQAAYRMKVLRGPSELRKCWGPLRAAYDHATRVAAQKAADMAQQASTPNAPSGVNTAAAGK
jgi:hypothetical protein